MNRRLRITGIALTLFSVVLVEGLSGQALDFLMLRASPELALPVGDSATNFQTGLGISGQARISVPALAGFQPLLTAGYWSFPTPASISMTSTTFGLGIGYTLYVAPRVGIGATALAGIYSAAYDDLKSSNIYFKGGIEGSYRFSPSVAANLGASYMQFTAKQSPLYSGLAIELSLNLSFAGMRETDNLTKEQVEFKPVFPVLYSQYDKNELGRVKFTNHEDGDIQNIKVSFFAKQFMERPKESAKVDVLYRGKSVEVPLYALFTADVLKLTEGTKALGEVIVEYEFLGVKRTAVFEEPLRINNRNALNWADDRRAAAFVSSKDTAVLRYSKRVTGLLRDNGLPGVSQNLRYAIGLFENLKEMKVNYVVDPTTPYAEFSSKTDTIDFLQFPFQTFSYHGGDCDDLSILFASILESVGIKSAFITVPGHIYVAFALDMSEEEARDSFMSVNDLIFQGGNTWIPIEITLLNQSFQKAWSEGAKEWRDNRAKGKLLPMADSWKIYDPVGPPDQNVLIEAPTEGRIVENFNRSMSSVVVSELEPKVNSFLADYQANRNPRTYNKIGLLYSRYGLYERAYPYFGLALDGGFRPAIINRANVEFIRGQYGVALNSYDKARAYNPEDVNALVGLAKCNYQMEKFDKAAEWYDQIVKINPGLAEQYAGLAAKRTSMGTVDRSPVADAARK